MKKCSKCNKSKSINNFYKNSGMADGHTNECKDCAKARVKKSARNIKKKCIVCGKSFGTCISEINRGGGKVCSRKCYYKRQKATIKHGSKSHAWKGGRLKSTAGYILIYKPKHSRANGKGYVPEHLLAMEKIIGRPIKKIENVHHIDGDKTNNKKNNLMLFPTLSAHMKFHWMMEKRNDIKRKYN